MNRLAINECETFINDRMDGLVLMSSIKNYIDPAPNTFMPANVGV